MNEIQEQFHQQLGRLIRHYSNSIKTYDSISLLDLSSSLRIWTEFKEKIKEIDLPVLSKNRFSFLSPPRELKHIHSGNTVWFGVDKKAGIFTLAHQGEIIGGNEPSDLTIGTNIKFDGDGRLYCSCAFFNNKCQDSKLIAKIIACNNIKYSNFTNWLNTDIIRVYENKNLKFNYSRELLIKRVANGCNGSHLSIGPDTEKDIDIQTKKLFDYKIAGLPLPYFALISIAKQIIDNFSRY